MLRGRQMRLFCRHKTKEILFCYNTYYSDNGDFKAVYVARCVKCNKLFWLEKEITFKDLGNMRKVALKYFNDIYRNADKIRDALLEEEKMQDAKITPPSEGGTDEGA